MEHREVYRHKIKELKENQSKNITMLIVNERNSDEVHTDALLTRLKSLNRKFTGIQEEHKN